MRDHILAGQIFGPRAEPTRAALAAFLTDPAPHPAEWFGADALPPDTDALLAAIDRDIAAIDAMIGTQLDAILHAPRLTRLEGMWRGLAWLLDTADPDPRVHVRLLAAAWTEVARDQERAASFDASALFRLLYEQEFGISGGTPFGLLLVDHEVRHRPGPGATTDDPAVIAGLAAIGAAAFCPIVFGASPALLDADGWSDLALAADPAFPLRDAAHARWNRVATLEDARFVAVALPRVLARPPWPDDPARGDGFRYRETSVTIEDRVWMAAGYPFAAAVLRAFTQFAWPADIRGVDQDRIGGGLVTSLPVEPLSTDPPARWAHPPLELTVTTRQEQALVAASLMPMVGLPHTQDAAFVALRSLQTPASLGGPSADAAIANARLSSHVHSMLCAGRFAHYIKVLGRELIGTVLTAAEIETRLQAWLSRYINSNFVAGPETRAKAPLLAGRVEVREDPARPGAYRCRFSLQPHFQLEDVSATFRLTTEIAAPGRAA